MALCKRVIGVVLIENGLVVRRVGFKTIAIVGRAEVTIKYLNNWNVDEVFFINVGKKKDISHILKKASVECFVPITVGGSISSVQEVDKYMNNGADKVVIGKHANNELLSSICNKYGSQSVCLSIDKDHNQIPPFPCGEILLHDASRDGKGNGLNIEILKNYNHKKSLIAMGGIGNFNHIVEGLRYANAVAIGNLLHFKEISVIEAKKKAMLLGIEIRH